MQAHFLLMLALAPAAWAVIPTFSPADLVLGQPGFSAGVPDPPPTATSLSEPAGIAIDPATGKVFVEDTDHDRILRYPNFATLQNGAAAEAVFGQADFTSEGFIGVNEKAIDGSGLAIDASGNLWVADVDHNRVLMIPNAATAGNFPSATKVLGQATFTAGTIGNSASAMGGPNDVCLDAAGNLYVFDRSNHRITRFDDAASKTNGAAADAVFGQVGFNFSVPAAGAAGLNTPTGGVVAPDGTLWVADSENHRVLAYANAASASSPGAFLVLGQADFNAIDSGLSSRRMQLPTNVFMDAQGTLWVLDSGNNRILGFKNARTRASGSAADFVLGQKNFNTAIAGVAKRRLDNPFGEIAGDVTGALWITDLNNNRVLRFSPDRKKPVVKVKGGKTKIADRGKITLRGTARDAVAIEEVRVRIPGSRARKARGTDKWKAVVRVAPGTSVVRVTAFDTAGNRSNAARVVVTRE